MSNLHLLSIDQLQKDATLPVIPNPPLLTSQKSGWNNIHLAYFRQPAWELPEFFILQHTITLVGSSRPVEVEFGVEGRVYKVQYCPSDNSCIELFPANLPYKIRWLSEVVFTHFYLDPTFVSQMAHETIDPDRVNILFEPKWSDPLMYNICQALRASLESDGSGDGFYGDSMAIAMAAHLLRHYATRKHQLREYEDGLST